MAASASPNSVSSRLHSATNPTFKASGVIADRGYDGATADLWYCGVVLFVLLTGWLPFDDRNLAIHYQKANMKLLLHVDLYHKEHVLTEETGPVLMNAFQLIAMSVSHNYNADVFIYCFKILQPTTRSFASKI